MHLFADDEKLFEGIACPQSSQHNIDKLQVWTQDWLLQFNVEKFCVWHLGPNGKLNNLQPHHQSKRTTREQRRRNLVTSLMINLNFTAMSSMLFPVQALVLDYLNELSTEDKHLYL